MLVRHSSLQVVSAQPLLASLLEQALHDRLPDYPPLKVILDQPIGYATTALQQLDPRWAFVLTDNPCPEYLDNIWSAGVRGLACNIRSLEELTALLKRVETEGRARLTPTAASTLTPNETKLLRLVAQGLVNKEIARELGIADQTVQNGLTRVFLKLGVRGRSGAMQYYWGIDANLQVTLPPKGQAAHPSQHLH